MCANNVEKRVFSKIKRMWPETNPEEIIELLNQYGTESWESGRARVQLAILKLSEGNVDRLPELVRMAKRDWRDVLAYAEYPEEMRTHPLEMQKKSPQETKAIRKRDRQQYEEWLLD
jgi:hypothetical protein